jgi:segregation and condensation protein A
MLRQGERFHARTVPVEERYEPLAPDILAQTSVLDVARAAALALGRVDADAVFDVSHVSPLTLSVDDAMKAIAEQLSAASETTFEALLEGAEDGLVVVVHFLAILELFKADAIELRQASRFGDIALSWTGAKDIDAVLEEFQGEAMRAAS